MFLKEIDCENTSQKLESLDNLLNAFNVKIVLHKNKKSGEIKIFNQKKEETIFLPNQNYFQIFSIIAKKVKENKEGNEFNKKFPKDFLEKLMQLF